MPVHSTDISRTYPAFICRNRSCNYRLFFKSRI